MYDSNVYKSVMVICRVCLSKVDARHKYKWSELIPVYLPSSCVRR